MAMGAAIVGSSLIGAASASSSSKAAGRAASSQAQAEQNKLNFAMEQYEDYKKLYGDIEENLSNFYKDMTPDRATAIGISNVEQEYNRAYENIQTNFAQRGLTGSGLALKTDTDLELSRAGARGQVRTNAPYQAAQEQQNFLRTGKGLQQQAISGVMGAYGQQANMYGQQASAYRQQASQGWSNVGQTIGSGISSYMTYNALQNQQAALAGQQFRLPQTTGMAMAPQTAIV